ncbi:helicase C-terminal domain-containing protein [Patescibacteria group bacterium]
MSIYAKPIISLDLETTDVDPENGKIIEVAAVRFVDGKEVDHFRQLIDPGVEVPSFITSLTGISDEDVSGQPRFSEIKNKLQDFIGNDPIVGHNIYFDTNFLKAEGLETTSLNFDTWQLATMLIQNVASHSLETLAENLAIDYPESHRALNDARVAAELFYALLERLAKVPKKDLKQIIEISQRGEWPLSILFENAAGASKASKKPALKKKAPIKGKGPAKLSEIDKIFEEKGPLKKVLPEYKLRESQVRLTKNIAEELATGQHALIEAEPGVGRTIGYLLPLAYYTQHQKNKACIVPYTRDLLEQIYYQDLPAVQAVTPFELKTAILRKPYLYLCSRRLEKFMAQKTLETDEINLITKIILWQDSAREGIFTEMTLTNQEERLIGEISADNPTCREGKCSGSGTNKCFYNEAHDKAEKAQLVFLNQTALAEEAKNKKRNIARKAKTILFDEAHHLEEAITRQTGIYLHQKKIYEYLASWSADFPKIGIINEAVKLLRGKEGEEQVKELKESIKQLEEQTTLWLGLIGMFFRQHAERSGYFIDRLVLDESNRGEADWSRIKSSAETLFAQYRELFKSASEIGKYVAKADKSNQNILDDIEAAIQSGEEIIKQLEQIVLEQHDSGATWLTVSDRAETTFRFAPVAVGDYLNKNFFEKNEHVFLIGATLTTENKFDYLRNRLGVPGTGVKEIKIPSPYQYQDNALVYIPNDTQLPSKPGHHDDVAQVIRDTALVLKGKTVGLFTSIAAARAVYDRIAPELQEAGINVVGQGVTGGKGKVLSKFLSAEPGVLLATGNLWEELDIPGEDLSALVIAKMPFEVPSDPVYAAREKEYDNRFMDFAIPQAILKFKQGVQRLLRHPDDRGVIIIMDKRVESEEYGLAFQRSLPAVGVETGSKNEITERIKDFFSL